MSKGLEALEKIKNNLRLFGFDEDTDNFKLLNIIEKELKALEIIKNKQVVIPRLLCWRGLSDYNFPLLPEYWLEQEEYDLLKEVL